MRTTCRGSTPRSREEARSPRPSASRTEAEEFLRTRTTEAEERGAALGAEAEQAAAEVRAAIESYRHRSNAHEPSARSRADRSRAPAGPRDARRGEVHARACAGRSLRGAARLLQAQIDELRGGPRQPARRVPRREAHVSRSDRSACAGGGARGRAVGSRPSDDTSDIRAAPNTPMTEEPRPVAEAVSDTAEHGRRDRRRRNREAPTEPRRRRLPLRSDPGGPGRAGDRARTPRRAGRPRGRGRRRRAGGGGAGGRSTGRRSAGTGARAGARGRGRARRHRQAWRARRAEVIDPLLASVAKRAKRTAQDDQNALLDAVRRHKGRPDVGPGAHARGRPARGLGRRGARGDRRGLRRGPGRGGRRRGRGGRRAHVGGGLVDRASPARASRLRDRRRRRDRPRGPRRARRARVSASGRTSRSRTPSPTRWRCRGRAASTTPHPMARCSSGSRSWRVAAPTATTTASNRP